MYMPTTHLLAWYRVPPNSDHQIPWQCDVHVHKNDDVIFTKNRML